MNLFWFLNISLYALTDSFTFIKNSRYCYKKFNLILTKDDFPFNDDDTEQSSSSVIIEEENLETILKKRQKYVYDGCDQRKPLNLSDKDSLLYYYQEFYEVLQKHELLKKLQSNSISDHDKLKIIKDCDYLLNNTPKTKPFYKGFEEFF